MGPDGITYNTAGTVLAEVNGNAATMTLWEPSAELGNLVRWYNTFDVTWYISTVTPGYSAPVGTSKNEVFVTLAEPQCSPAFRTVLYLATKNGGADEDECFANTWACFSTGSGPANPKGWCESAKGYTRPLCYYLQGRATTATTAAALLSGDDSEPATGKCSAWAEFFAMCMWANGVDDADRIFVEPPSGIPEFTVKNCHPTQVDFPNEPVWKYKAEHMWPFDDGIPGQGSDLPGMGTPGAKRFPNHEIVRRDGYYYDPSYGVAAADVTAYTTAAVGAWWEDSGLYCAYLPDLVGTQYWMDLRLSPCNW